METKQVGHTPGPWHVSRSSRYVRYRLPGSDTGYNLADCDMGAPPTEMFANARLIAAAPELLAACEAAEANLSPLYCSEHLVMKLLRAAIAKATGDAA